MSLLFTGCEAVKKEGRTQMHNVKEKGFNNGSDRQYINKSMEHKTQDYGGRVTVNNEQTNESGINEDEGMRTRA